MYALHDGKAFVIKIDSPTIGMFAVTSVPKVPKGYGTTKALAKKVLKALKEEGFENYHIKEIQESDIVSEKGATT